MNPKQAIGSLVTTGGLKLIIRNGQPVAWTWVQNVFDGRDSSLEVTITFQGQTLKTTAKLLFNKFPSIGAFTTEKGIILLGPKFFNNNNREGRAKIIIHEAVVHKGFRRHDWQFDSSRNVETGSRNINNKFYKYYRTIEPQLITP
jgi:hypothetical protein